MILNGLYYTLPIGWLCPEPEKSIENTHGCEPNVMLVITRQERHEKWSKLCFSVGTLNLQAIAGFASSTKMARSDHIPKSGCHEVYICRENTAKWMLPFLLLGLLGLKRLIIQNAPYKKKQMVPYQSMGRLLGIRPAPSWQEMQLRSSAITYNTAVSVCQETDTGMFCWYLGSIENPPKKVGRLFKSRK